MDGLLTVSEARKFSEGKKIVFTNGVFDILHAGHVRYLSAAKALGDALVIGLNSDASVKLLGKGPDRPINPQLDRAEVLLALKSVDAVVIFDEQTPERLIAEMKPNVHVKGGDYTVETLPEAKIILAYGGEVVIMPTLEGRSSTRIIDAIRKD